jgi:tetratricopeptide (TPR) repeat protein
MQGIMHHIQQLPTRHASRWVGALTLALTIAGCASANKRYEQGYELEQQGQYIQAARKYIDALKKDGQHPEARARLREIGPRAVNSFLENAELAAASGREADAADSYLRLDEFLASAAAVGEPLPRPSDYADQRRAMFDEAIGALIDDGRSSEEIGAWYAAKRAYNRADRYFPDTEQVDLLIDGLIRTHLGWCETDLDMGRYRSSVEHADEAFALAGGPDSEAGMAALELRATAIELGTIPVAVTPLWRTDDAARFLPEGFLSALNDELELVAWSEPPMFIEVMDPLLVRRALRDLRYHSTLMTIPEASRLGREIGAHTVVTADIEIFTVTERDVREEVRNTKTRAGKPVSYLRRSGTLDYRMRLHYTVVDLVSQRAVHERTIEVRESGRFERAVYDGDWTNLDLTRNERRWFEADRQIESTFALEEQLIREAVAEFSEHLYRDLLNQIS